MCQASPPVLVCVVLHVAPEHEDLPETYALVHALTGMVAGTRNAEVAAGLRVLSCTSLNRLDCCDRVGVRSHGEFWMRASKVPSKRMLKKVVRSVRTEDDTSGVLDIRIAREAERQTLNGEKALVLWGVVTRSVRAGSGDLWRLIHERESGATTAPP